MPTDFPAMAYREDGASEVVESAAALKKLGAKWSRTPSEVHIAAIRSAAGAVAQIVNPSSTESPDVRQ